jgi:DNA-binding PadR family transcriptional regulator
LATSWKPASSARNRPTKRLFSLTADGVAELDSFAAAPRQPTVLRDELTVAVQAADVVGPEGLLRNLERRIEQARSRRANLEGLERAILGGRSEEEFVRTTRHLGPYLTCRRGIRHEADTEEWCGWAIELLRTRSEARRHAE